MHAVGFIGLGNMGGGMAANLVKAGHAVTAFDISAPALERASAAGCKVATTAAQAVREVDAVITMLPAGTHVRQVWEADVIPNAAPDTLLIDCSTIDVDSARHVTALARDHGFAAADAPVSGGIMAAHARTPAVLVGCEDEDCPAVGENLP